MKSRRSRVELQVRAERLDARRVAQVEPEDLEPIAPLLEVGLLRVAVRRIAREAGGDDQLGARPQQLDPRLVADLHAPAGEQRDATAKVGGLRALAEVEVAARAGTAGRRTGGCRGRAACRRSSAAARRPRGTRVVVHVGLLELGGREDVGRREHRLLAQHADPGLGEHASSRCSLAAFCCASSSCPTRRATRSGLKTSPPPRAGGSAPRSDSAAEQAAVANDRFQQLGGCLQLLGDFVGDAILRADRHGPQGTSGACGVVGRCCRYSTDRPAASRPTCRRRRTARRGRGASASRPTSSRCSGRTKRDARCRCGPARPVRPTRWT